MASIIRVKRSTGTLAPATLNYGELGLTIGVGTHGNSGGRLFVGDNSSNPLVVGGRYYTDLLSIAPGLVAGQSNPTTPANGFVAILDSNRKVNQWNVDNITIDLNTISSTNVDGDINLDPDGTGEIVIPDDTYLTFGTSKDVKLRYDEATDDRFEIEGADWNFANNVAISISDTTTSTTPTTGALTVAGGVGFATHLNVGGNVDIDLDLNVDGGDITTNLTAFNLLNANATTVNAFGAGTNIVIGATSGIATIRNAIVDLDGDLNIDGGDVTSNTATLNLFNTNVTNANVLGAATALVIGATSGIATIRNVTLSVPNATTLNLGATSSATSVNFQSTPNTSFVSIAATTNATTTTSGALRVAGGVGIASNVYIGGILNVTGNQSGSNLTLTGNLQVDGNTTLGNASGDVVTITGSINHTGPLTNTGGVTIDNIGISSNVISTRSGGGNILYIDPYPDGLSNEGMVVIKGDLQVDGTTTTVNSNNVTVNDAILSLGEVTSVRTVVATVASGVSTISLDSVVGINTGDIITGNAALPNSGLTTITAYNTSTKIITFTGTTSSGISTTSQLTVIHAYDTNTDRGISFDYNTGVGTANNKTGFFGYHDTTNSGSAAPVRSWTYVPDATNSNNVITGTRGYLDIKGIYYQTGDFNTHGVVFFDNDGLQTSTNNPSTASSTRTSTQILTAVTEINLSLPSSTSVTAGDQVTQVNNSGAYGVVKNTVSGTTITLIGAQGTFDTTNDLKVNGANISIIPGTVTIIYTNKPMWTDTLDGGTF